MIYFDNAATSLQKPETVAEAVYHGIQNMGNSGRGAYEASLEAGRVIYETRDNLAELFHIEDCSRIAFTSNATESLNIAIKGLFKSGDHVVTTELEHNSVLRPLYEMEEKGLELTIVKCDSLGRVSLENIEREIKVNTKGVICTHSSNLTGNVVDIQRIGSLCKQYHLLLAVDASQSAGVFPIDVEKQQIDVLCFTGHKGLLGPQGTGGIYVKEGVSIRPLKSGGSGIQTYSKSQPLIMPELLEAGTLNGHGIAGLHASLIYLNQIGIDTIRKKEQTLMWQFYKGIKEISKVKIYGDFSVEDRAPIVSINIGDMDSSIICDQLARGYKIFTRGGGHCAPLMHKALGTREQGAVRFSFSHYNTELEVNQGIQAVKEIALED